MRWHPEGSESEWRWALPGGTVEVRDGRLHRPGLPGPLVLPSSGTPALAPDLSADDVLAVLASPVVLAAGASVVLRLAWPVVVSLEVGGVAVDAWRPGQRKGLVGTVESGRVVAAVRVPELTGDAVPGAGEGTVRVRLANRHDAPVPVRHLLVPEDALDLWEGPDGLLLGDLIVDVLAPDRATARADTPTLPGDATLVGRKGRRVQAPRGLFEWSAPSARSVEFAP